ncbi:MAG TPA: ABC transporter permease subunit [Ktedonobacterales bacterium]|nr:ABC transporter permease subunit [Ktedonobacterales bacterium]
MTLNWPPVWLSLRVAGFATAGALAVGLWLGHRVATREFMGRKATLGLLALLFATPVVILAGVLLRPVFPWQAGAAVGVIAALPPVVFGSRNRLQDLDREYGNAARSLGCSEWRIFWRVMLPLGWRPILAAAAIAFVRVWMEWTIVAAL